MRVADILARKKLSALITIKPSESAGALSQLLKERRVGAAIVSEDGQTIDGIISERDLAFGLAARKAELHAIAVSELMTKAVITCTPNDDIAFVASTMLSRNIRHLPVQVDHRFVGMVSMRDVLSSRLDDLQQQNAQLRTFMHEISREPQDRE